MSRHLAIRNIYPNVVTIDGESDARDKSGNPVVIDEKLVKAEEDKIKEEYDAQSYARARQSLYPAIGDQLDDLYHKGAFSAEMKAKLKKVKDDNPKPE